MTEKNSSNQSIDRMFSIIEVMASSGKPMRLNEIAERSGVAASTAMRILNALCDNGYASQNEETYLYSLSYKFIWIGSQIRESLTLNKLLRPYLDEISRRLNLSCALGTLNDIAVTYVDEVIATQQMLRVYHHLGQAHPLYANACGKLFLSSFSKADLNRYYRQTQLTPFTPRTLSTRDALEKDLARIRECGYSVNDEERILGMRCVAVPLLSSDGKPFVGISVSGTSFQIARENIPLVAATVQSVVDKIYEECRPVLSLLQSGELL